MGTCSKKVSEVFEATIDYLKNDVAFDKDMFAENIHEYLANNDEVYKLFKQQVNDKQFTKIKELKKSMLRNLEFLITLTLKTCALAQYQAICLLANYGSGDLETVEGKAQLQACRDRERLQDIVITLPLPTKLI